MTRDADVAAPPEVRPEEENAKEPALAHLRRHHATIGEWRGVGPGRRRRGRAMWRGRGRRCDVIIAGETRGVRVRWRSIGMFPVVVAAGEEDGRVRWGGGGRGVGRGKETGKGREREKRDIGIRRLIGTCLVAGRQRKGGVGGGAVGVGRGIGAGVGVRGHGGMIS